MPTTTITAMVNIDDYWTRPTSELLGRGRFSAPELGEDDLPGAYLETDGQLVLGAVEYLGFATNRGDLDGHVDSNGWLTPGESDYRDDAERCGVDPSGGHTIVGIGPDEPNVVIFGRRDELIRVARDILAKLGG
ncbi:hypothetical protein B8W67_05925 [Mycolicibacillus koreensis]|uniref:Uncharacterized protein n=1 Tax=Mycolicibacillus koreensis TaxID=1069220 RepID=A0AA91SSN8_9MYCO|nr:hypothetical protein B8W67_05925 [Mycolicibacillus koreensis]